MRKQFLDSSGKASGNTLIFVEAVPDPCQFNHGSCINLRSKKTWTRYLQYRVYVCRENAENSPRGFVKRKWAATLRAIVYSYLLVL